ncbi:hypothetical protein PF010_g23133 [Phytophthora fragariae]|nr:hypothetical protein PF003_g28321 [Phytophthora fragariae]KAE8925150.1 hypothetical protein PF009_g24633 [Phytophthora fragariae]KAE8979901.1 hypothetical protein PF011_g22661 [Phytophthora fragariae]KAE9078419.1 hypothetical protein PF010_g23133 [Phytophthora fragariae]KAE9078518.1 hypothetical protein PF007_g23824 [Phytophthora fragariae]
MRTEEEDTSVDSQLARGAIADSAAGSAKGAATGAVAGVGVWGLVGPAVHMLGFMSSGIASGSAAASMMSTAALANAGSVASGSTVAVLQSVGALGIATPTGIGIAAVGAVVGAAAPLTTWYFSRSAAQASTTTTPSPFVIKAILGRGKNPILPKMLPKTSLPAVSFPAVPRDGED